MRVKYNIEESILASILKREYGIQVREFTFIPWGLSAYSYKVRASNGECYYLKLFDTTDDQQKRSAKLLDSYLPMTWKMYHKGIFRNLTYPIKTKDGRFKTRFKKIILVLFNFIEGTTLSKSSSRKDTLEKIAKAVAQLHHATPVIDTKKIRQEQFDKYPQEGLIRGLSVLESTTKFDNPYKEALQELILPRKENILHAMNAFSSLQSTVEAIQKERVLCHGDLWAGNIISHQDEIFFLDWEFAVISFPERDLINFIGNDFEFFFKQYEHHIGKKVILHSDLLRYYLYRRRLNHLQRTILNILFKNTNEVDNRSDLNMLTYYYADKLDSIESVITNTQGLLKDNMI
jgi:spectinomycin phosphotransferase